MSNRLVVSVKTTTEGEKIVLFGDDYANSYLLFEDELPEWDSIWYMILSCEGFDDMLRSFQVNHDTETVIVDENNLPVEKEEEQFGVPNITFLD